ncbi:unnamed protein product [Soboliphyme baturini]|uniref:Uncharacterized protein n=1 Tax=Soboliphyme baturini TaxID=241478 RepID=A0A3P8EGY6_9BILA|nr:unnamed protein product [Soboliphyme baturini]
MFRSERLSNNAELWQRQREFFHRRWDDNNADRHRSSDSECDVTSELSESEDLAIIFVPDRTEADFRLNLNRYVNDPTLNFHIS